MQAAHPDSLSRVGLAESVLTAMTTVLGTRLTDAERAQGGNRRSSSRGVQRRGYFLGGPATVPRTFEQTRGDARRLGRWPGTVLRSTYSPARDALERRAAWVAISIAITLAVNASGSVAYGFGGLGTWELIFYVAGLLCLGAAGVLLVAALAPDAVRPFSLEDRTRFVFFALALFVVAMIVIVGLSTHAAIEAHRHPQASGGSTTGSAILARRCRTGARPSDRKVPISSLVLVQPGEFRPF